MTSRGAQWWSGSYHKLVHTHKSFKIKTIIAFAQMKKDKKMKKLFLERNKIIQKPQQLPCILVENQSVWNIVLLAYKHTGPKLF